MVVVEGLELSLRGQREKKLALKLSGEAGGIDSALALVARDELRICFCSAILTAGQDHVKT